jgi:hypothetical protein
MRVGCVRGCWKWRLGRSAGLASLAPEKWEIPCGARMGSNNEEVVEKQSNPDEKSQKLQGPR